MSSSTLKYAAAPTPSRPRRLSSDVSAAICGRSPCNWSDTAVKARFVNAHARGRGACAPRSILRCRPCRRSSFRRRDSSATGRPPRGTASAAARRCPCASTCYTGEKFPARRAERKSNLRAARMRPSGRATRPRRKMRRCFAACAADSERPLPRRGSPHMFSPSSER